MMLSKFKSSNVSAELMGSVPQAEMRTNWRKMGKHLRTAAWWRTVLGERFFTDKRKPPRQDPLSDGADLTMPAMPVHYSSSYMWNLTSHPLHHQVLAAPCHQDSLATALPVTWCWPRSWRGRRGTGGGWMRRGSLPACNFTQQSVTWTIQFKSFFST